MVPVVERQIAEARKWDRFPELESRIVAFLQADPQISLDRAYLKAYQEDVAAERARVSTDRNKIRTEVLGELRAMPQSSSAPVGGVKPGQQQHDGPRNLEDIIREASAGIKR